MGGGKTTQTVQYLEKNCNNENENDNSIWMTPNIALADNTFERMKNSIIQFYTTMRKKLKRNLKEFNHQKI